MMCKSTTQKREVQVFPSFERTRRVRLPSLGVSTHSLSLLPGMLPCGRCCNQYRRFYRHCFFSECPKESLSQLSSETVAESWGQVGAMHFVAADGTPRKVNGHYIVRAQRCETPSSFCPSLRTLLVYSIIHKITLHPAVRSKILSKLIFTS